MTQAEIMNILPHRKPMLLVDEVTVCEDGAAEGRCVITGEEWFLQGHFPGNPVVPGVMLCEMMAQTCCVLLGGEDTVKGTTPYFTGLDKVKFRHPVKPGNTVVTRCRITRQKAPFYFAEGTVHVDGKLCASASFSFALVAANM